MPVIAQAPSGLRFVLAYAAASRTASRSSCSIDRQQVVRDGARLRRLRVRVRGEHVLAMPRRPARAAPARSAQRRRRSASSTSSRCCIRYIVMSMSLRERAVCSRPGRSSPQRLRRSAVRRRRTGPRRCRRRRPAGSRRARSPSSALADRVPRRSRATMPRSVEHHEMRVVDRHQRREELRLGVLEVLVEDAGDVFGRECATTAFPG